MEKIDFKNLPDKTAPINAANLNKMQDNTEKAIGEKLDKTSKATSTEAIAGTNNTKYTTPCSVKSAIDKALEGYTPSGGGSGGDTLPIGAILPFSSDTIPNGWLLCDGSSFSTTSYPELFDVIGTTYGYDDDRNPKLPDLRGRVAVGKKDAASADDTEFSSLGKTGGEKEHTLTINEMPSHNHLRDIENKIVNNGSGGAWSPSLKGTGNMTDENNSTRNTGGGQAHNNLQPYIVTNYIIKAKMTIVTNGEVIQENDTATTENVYSAKAIDNKLTTNITTGQEVATNEYIDGKRVYLKRATFTTPNAVDIWKTMITIPANSEIVNSYQVYEAESSKYPFPFSNNNESMQIYYNSNDGTINVKINFNYALNRDGYIIVKYTKNI